MQLVVLILTIAAYQGQLMKGLVPLIAVVGLGAALSLKMLPLVVHETLLAAQIFISLSSRVPQIYMAYKMKSTGQVAFMTYFLAFGGAGARVFTTAMNVAWDKGKATLLLQFGLAFLLNGIIIAQILVYSRPKPVKADKKADKPKPKADKPAGKKGGKKKD